MSCGRQFSALMPVALHRFGGFVVPLELAHIEVVEKAALRQQFVEFAALDDLAVVEHQHLVGVADGAEAVGNDKADEETLASINAQLREAGFQSGEEDSPED
jgi:hypothetical protein